MANSVIIRASSLPEFRDCPRRAAARAWPDMLKRFGFELANAGSGPKTHHVGALIGTAAHAGFAELLIQQRDQIALDVGEAERVAREKWTQEVKKGDLVSYDDTTEHIGMAHEQIFQMLQEFAVTVAPYSKPVLIEHQWIVDAGHGFELSGTIDELDYVERLEDHKTGAREPSAPEQMGGYALLAETEGHRVRWLRLNWVPRMTINKPQRTTVYKPYEVEPCKKEAYAVIKDIKGSVKAFQKTGRPQIFGANPRSMRCKARYCPVFNTPFCDMGGC